MGLRGQIRGLKANCFNENSATNYDSAKRPHTLLSDLLPVFRMTLASLKKLYKRVGTFGGVVAHLNLQLVCQTGEKVSSKNMEKVLSKYYHNRLSGPLPVFALRV